MAEPAIELPGRDEYAPFYAGYIEEAGAGPLLDMMQAQIPRFEMMARITEDQALYRYSHNKWSVKEVIGHLSDGERVFSYRAMRIGRGDLTPLAGFDENLFVHQGKFDRRPTRGLVAELVALRRLTILLYRGMSPEQLFRRGTANGVQVSTRALGWITMGHAEHHLKVLAERYGIVFSVPAGRHTSDLS